MKKILKPLTLSAIALFTMSCSSDDNSTPSIPEEGNTLVVLDKITITKYSNVNGDKLLSKPELSEESTYTYTYNELGKVTSSLYKGKHEINHENGQDFSLNSVYTYNTDGTLKEILSTEESDKSVDEHFIYEYNDKKQVIKIIDKVSNDNLTYTYDNNNRITSVASDRKNSPYKLDYTYDTKNNIIKANYISKQFEKTDYYTYDDKFSPFVNMSINNIHVDISLPENLPETFIGVNNVVTYKNKEFQIFNETSVYEYNTNNFPTKVTTHHTLNPKNISSIISYTYKTIKIKK